MEVSSIMKLKNIMIIIITLLFVFSSSVYALSQKERLNLTIDIGSYIEMDISNNIHINLERPWKGGIIKEAKSKLFLLTNANIELSWVCKGLKSKATGRVLPLGIPEKLFKTDNSLFSKVESFGNQPFGLTANLVKRGVGTAEKQKNQYVSYIDKEKTLRSQDIYSFSPGIHEFDIVLQYYWSADGKWSEIRAGEYNGQIIFTVLALD